MASRRTEAGPVYAPEPMPWTCPRCAKWEPTTARNKRLCNACAAALKSVREAARRRAIDARKRARKGRPA